ncbi:hypothetical protein [Streptomyces chrestomyceticus]|uniref:hypothetical protein n=1 Tax=Streptomyces chrestomyceticus TaxID=68185 RepID=UPI0035A95304
MTAASVRSISSRAGPSTVVGADFRCRRSGTCSPVSYRAIFTEHFFGTTTGGSAANRTAPATVAGDPPRSTRRCRRRNRSAEVLGLYRPRKTCSSFSSRSSSRV